MTNNNWGRKPTLKDRTTGRYGKYYIQKIVRINNPDFVPMAKVSQVIDNSDQYINALAPVDKEADYFVLRLDESPSNDYEHIKACRIAINAYADAIRLHLPQLSEELKAKYPLF